jgi:hypothetical protein
MRRSLPAETWTRKSLLWDPQGRQVEKQIHFDELAAGEGGGWLEFFDDFALELGDGLQGVGLLVGRVGGRVLRCGPPA